MNINDIKTISELEEYRQRVNEECDNRRRKITNLTKASELSEKPFGYIKECFEEISPLLFESKEGKNLINKYIKAVNESRNLSSLHNLYESVRKVGNDSDLDFFLDSISKFDWNVDKKTVNEDVRTLGLILAEGYIMATDNGNVDLPSENQKLDKALEYISENSINGKNITDYSNAVSIVKEHIKAKDASENIFEEKDLDELATDLMESFNKKYEGEFSEEEITALKEVSSTTDRISVFEKYKNQCIDKINETKEKYAADGDMDSVKKLSNVVEQVSVKSYNLDTLGNDICNLIELKNIF